MSVAITKYSVNLKKVCTVEILILFLLVIIIVIVVAPVLVEAVVEDGLTLV